VLRRKAGVGGHSRGPLVRELTPRGWRRGSCPVEVTVATSAHRTEPDAGSARLFHRPSLPDYEVSDAPTPYSGVWHPCEWARTRASNDGRARPRLCRSERVSAALAVGPTHAKSQCPIVRSLVTSGEAGYGSSSWCRWSFGGSWRSTQQERSDLFDRLAER
jgi:hypothetical protein